MYTTQKKNQETNMKVIRYLILDKGDCEVSLIKQSAKNFIDLLYKILTSKNAKESRYEKILWKKLYETFLTMTEVSRYFCEVFEKPKTETYLYVSFCYGLHGYYGKTLGTIDYT